MSTAKETKNARRERLAEQRAANAKAEKRRQRLFVAAAVVVVVVAFVGIGVAVQASRNDTSGAALPATVTETGGPIVRNPGVSGVPTLDYWEDFQCPACKQMEDAAGATVRQLAASGTVIVRYHMLSFLDGNLNNDSSHRSANAFACSADAGKQGEYHDIVYANQPAKEGGGYTDEQLLQWGKDVGITGAALSTFNTCTTGDHYGDYVTSVQTAGSQQGINQTPSVFLNNQPLSVSVAGDPAALTKAIAAAAAK